jgi:hypothetical protein
VTPASALRRLPRQVASATARRPGRPAPARGGLARVDGWAVLATLAVLVLVNVPTLGADPWPFEPGAITAGGPLGFVVDAVGGEWDPEALRAGALVGGLAVALVAAASILTLRWSAKLVGALAACVVVLLVVPAVLLQAGLRDSTEPWFFTNDSTYQIELAGDLLRDGDNPYGHDYGTSGLERFYSLDGTVAEETRAERPALHHFLYFPGPAISAAPWSALPDPWDDYRFVVVLATLGCFAAVLVFRAPLGWRLAAAAVAAANPLAVRAAWFGNADATSLVFLLLAFALLTRARWIWTGAFLGLAIVFKQFALLVLPFFAVMALQRADRRDAWRAAAACGAVVLVGFLPFLAWDPGAFVGDTLPAGDDTYRIVGPGLASALVELGLIETRTSGYPFLALALLLWLPLTAWLVWKQVQARALWVGAAGFAVSMLVFLFLSRVFQPSFLVWPLVAVLVAVLLAVSERTRPHA